MLRDRYDWVMDPTHLPGGDVVAAGLDDLRQGLETVPALLVSIGAPRRRHTDAEKRQLLHAYMARFNKRDWEGLPPPVILGGAASGTRCQWYQAAARWPGHIGDDQQCQEHQRHRPSMLSAGVG